MNKRIIIGSRESKLAMIQTQMVKQHIECNYSHYSVEILPMKTTGDKILDRTLDKVGGKGLFVKELDLALADGRSDLSVHSLKDMPMDIDSNYPVVAYSKREDPRDVMILPFGVSSYRPDKPIGSSSLRRTLQLSSIFPNAEFKSIRGNVLTRLEKLDCGEYGALVLAAAGIKRLGLEHRIHRYFSTDEIIPAAGQGILAVQGKKDNDYSYLEGFHCEDSYYAALAERTFVKCLEGGCSSPTAAFAQIKEDGICLSGLYYHEKSGRYITGKQQGNIKDAEEIAIKLAEELKGKLLGEL